ncbi:MAG: exodeoxyribonuclease large subunit [Thermomicrobiales bacterium]|nr:exodeoxyribonuclease large subunit [Thermomicrobiales bacterium]
MNGRVLPVGAFVCLLRETLEQDPFYADLWLEGEISDLSRSSAGHTYFNLRDDDGCLKCVLFRGQALRQQQPLRMGYQLAIHGGLSIYPRSGSLQLIVDLVRPAGLGAAWLERELLRQRLEDEGLFDERRKRPLPAWPRAIGVVTSPHGAAWHDIQTVVRRRYPLVTLVLSPAQVQGDGAAESIVAAISAFHSDLAVDAIIVARGGGANDDLAAFDDERVVRAIFAAPAPVIAGVGHATDRTLTEEVADAFAPTPSAAAEICVPSAAHLDEQLRSLESRLEWALATQKADAVSASRALEQRLAAHSPTSSIRKRRHAVVSTGDRLRQAQGRMLAARHQEAATARALLDVLNPTAVLGRGYAAVQRSETGQPISSINQVARGDAVVAVLHDGTLSVTVDGKSDRSPLTAVATR